MRVLLILLMFLSGCASKPPEPVVAVPGEYVIPVLKTDNSVDRFTVEPDPDSLERMLFCIEGTDTVLCVAEEGGKAFRYLMPLGPLVPDAGT